MDILNGKKIADEILKNISRQIKMEKIKPGLAVVLVGKDEASEIYVRIKKKRAEEIGINFFLFNFDENSGEGEILEKIKNLNEDKKINGIIVQLPLPKKFDTQKIIDLINLEKDVDGFSSQGGDNIIEPVFPKSIIKLLDSSEQELKNKKSITITNSKLFGETMEKALEREKIKGEYILRKDVFDNLEKIKEADILISAIGEKGIVRGWMIKKGAIVIDGGVSKENKKVFGDVDFESTKNMRGFITPVPGGVGPVTVACLLENVLAAFKNQNKI